MSRCCRMVQRQYLFYIYKLVSVNLASAKPIYKNTNCVHLLCERFRGSLNPLPVALGVFIFIYPTSGGRWHLKFHVSLTKVFGFFIPLDKSACQMTKCKLPSLFLGVFPLHCLPSVADLTLSNLTFKHLVICCCLNGKCQFIQRWVVTR